METIGADDDTWGAFSGAGLTSIEIPASVEKIGSAAFYECTSLRTVTILAGSKLKLIDSSAFQECNLDTFEIPESVEKISTFAFKGNSKLASITLPKNLKITGGLVFCDCSEALKVYYDGTKSDILNVKYSYYSSYRHISDPEHFLKKDRSSSPPTYYDILYKCNVTYDVNGGTLPSNAPTWVYRKDTLNVTPTKNGYTFKGWTAAPVDTALSADKAYNAETDQVLNDVKLTAVWEENPVDYQLTVTGGTITQVVDKNGNTITDDISEPTVALPTRPS